MCPSTFVRILREIAASLHLRVELFIFALNRHIPQYVD